MKVDGQKITETDAHYAFELKKPFFSAAKKYAWSSKDVGFGVSRELIRTAHRNNKKIMVYKDGDSYEIAVQTIQNFFTESKIRPTHRAKGGIILVVIPESLFVKI